MNIVGSGAPGVVGKRRVRRAGLKGSVLRAYTCQLRRGKVGNGCRRTNILSPSPGYQTDV